MTDENLKKSNWVVVDPGMRTLMYMKDKNNKIFRYTNKRRLRETKRLKYQRLLQNYKDKNKISETENKLKDFNSRICSKDKFKEYVKKKNELNKTLLLNFIA